MYDYNGLYGVVLDTFGEDAVLLSEDKGIPVTIKIEYKVIRKADNAVEGQPIEWVEEYAETTHQDIYEGDILHIRGKEYRCASIYTNENGLKVINLSNTTL